MKQYRLTMNGNTSDWFKLNRKSKKWLSDFVGTMVLNEFTFKLEFR